MSLRSFSKLLLMICVVCVAPQGHAHRFYASFSQVDMQSSKGTIEITHRIFTHDIEDLLVRYQGGPSELSDGVIEEFLKEYIMQAFALYSSSGDMIPLNWVAVEVTLNDIYVYQEAVLEDGQQTVIIADRILMDIFDEQSNTVNVKLDGKIKSHTFNIDSKMYQVSFAGRTGEYPFEN